MRPNWRIGSLALLLGLAVVSCGGDDDGASGDSADAGGDDRPGVPAECPDGASQAVEIDSGAELPGIDGSRFEATSTLVGVTPIVLEDVPDGDVEAAQEAAAETDLLAYTVYVADYELDDSQVGPLGISPPADGTVLSFSIVPPTEEPLATGDVIQAGTPEFDSTTTFGTVGVQYQTGADDQVVGFAADTEGSGSAEVLHLDDDQLCLRFSQEGTIFGGAADGTPWAIETVVGGPLAPRADLGLS